MVQVCTMHSTAQVARILRIGRQTLHRWLNEGLKAPKKSRIGGVSIRFWTERDLKRARKYKAARYHQGGGRMATKKQLRMQLGQQKRRKEEARRKAKRMSVGVPRFPRERE
jgi:predicted DNA-binding transcriptional regulator AlpA